MKQNKSAPTRRDVAERAGVSVTIVSYVLNNNRYVAKEKRDRVLQAVKELHYRPNTVARALKGKRAITFCSSPTTSRTSILARSSKRWTASPTIRVI